MNSLCLCCANRSAWLDIASSAGAYFRVALVSTTPNSLSFFFLFDRRMRQQIRTKIPMRVAMMGTAVYRSMTRVLTGTGVFGMAEDVARERSEVGVVLKVRIDDGEVADVCEDGKEDDFEGVVAAVDVDVSVINDTGAVIDISSDDVAAGGVEGRAEEGRVVAIGMGVLVCEKAVTVLITAEVKTRVADILSIVRAFRLVAYRRSCKVR